MILAAALLMVKNNHKSLIYTPVYAPVELITPTAPVRKRVVKKKAAVKKTVVKKKVIKKTPVKKVVKKPTPIKKTAVKVKKTAPVKKAVPIKKAEPIKKAKPVEKAAPLKKNTVALKNIAPVPPPVVPKVVEKKISVEDAIAKFEAKHKVKDEEVMLAKRIEEIEKRNEFEEMKEKRERRAIKEELEAEAARARRSKDSETAAPFVSSRISLYSDNFDMRFKAYYARLNAKIASAWNSPSSKSEQIMAIVTIQISRSGDLLSHKLEESSGNRFFDNSAINSVIKSAPFAPLPEKFSEDIFKVGVRFCPGGCK